MAVKGSAGRLLLVDDSPINRRLALSVLRRMGYAADAVASAAQAIEAVRGGDYAAVLMDIWMPGMDGLDATAAIRELPPPKGTLPVIAMTAHSDESDRRRCLEAGMDAHIGKPIDRATLAALLRRLVGPPSDGSASTQGEIESYLSVENLVDDNVLNQLKNDAGPALVKDLIAAYMAETDERLSRIQAAISSGSFVEVGVEAHSMKSSSGTFGAIPLQALFDRLESAATQGDAQALADAQGELPNLVGRTWREFAARGYRPG